MRILVTFAVEAEFAPWRKVRQFVKHTKGSAGYFTARIGGASVNVVLTGVGGKSAWLETTKTVGDGQVDICVSSGLAGALRPEYQPGDILAAKEVQAISGKRVVASDAKLVQLAEEHGARAVGSFYSADRVIGWASEKRELGKVADAVEMEGGEVMYEARAFGARVVAIRGISDAAHEDLPLDFNRVMTAAGEVSIRKVLGEVVRHPNAAPALVRFGKQSRMAADKLGAFLDRYLEGVISSLGATMGAAAR
jgi:nucleoside phosphorylase